MGGGAAWPPRFTINRGINGYFRKHRRNTSYHDRGLSTGQYDRGGVGRDLPNVLDSQLLDKFQDSPEAAGCELTERAVNGVKREKADR